MQQQTLSNKYIRERLTERELQVFQLSGQGKKAREIAEILDIRYKTVETYYGNICSKLRLDGTHDLRFAAYHWVTENEGPLHYVSLKLTAQELKILKSMVKNDVGGMEAGTDEEKRIRDLLFDAICETEYNSHEG